MDLDPFSPSALPRVAAFDLDGTLLTSDKRVTPRTHRALAGLAARGVQLVVCTGRPPRSALAVTSALTLPQPIICFNGAAMCDQATGIITIRRRLDPAVALEALRRLRRAAPGVLVGLESEHGWYLDDALFEFRNSSARLGPVTPTGVGAVEEFVDEGAIKLLAQHANMPAAALAEPLADLDLYRTWSTANLLELLHPAVNKRAGLEELCARLQVVPAEVAAFGDQCNDVEMLAWAGRGYAMGNASAEARAAADVVIDANDQDGVAVVVESWLGTRSPARARG